MTKAIRLPSASSAPTKSFERTEEGITLLTSSVCEPCQVFSFGDYMPSAEPAPHRHVSIGGLVSKWAVHPLRRDAMEKARRWLADELHGGDAITLRTLRLRKGLSQQQLANAIGTSQPHIARIEGGADNLNIDTCRRIGRVLEVDMNSLDHALRQQQKINKAKSSS
ncbi:MAG: helix-turn-helix transcriptional regulator [Xanthomonadaceae bacterium]|nr:helix-turn-helix transcriptional regulator [Xanthomonadaceae bacterium]MDP2184103.1 helix-turn-helix transcriptional regulator [Xanthomonadales bacterium]MDZ4115883.1 helix-turn-helix transcriptional regulator [Xanthomonadaceae bacterium]MDZ4377200.1 helix-turn-helix transcriptional regulator [Xanthomonadaceae bacterium]